MYRSLMPYSLSLATSLVLVLTGCQKSPHNSVQASQDTHTPTNSTLETVKVSVIGTAPPFSFLDEKGKAHGIDIDVLNEVGKLQGFQPEFIITTWDGMFDNLDKGVTQLAVSGISYKPERADKYALSQSYFYNPSAIVYKRNTGAYQTLKDAQGKRIAASIGKGKSRQYAESVSNATLTLQKSPYLIFKEVVNGNADIGIYDQPVLSYMAKNNQIMDLVILPIENNDNPMTQTVVAAHKTQSKLIDKVNAGLTQLRAQGKLTDIEKRWMATTTGTTTVAALASTSASTIAVKSP